MWKPTAHRGALWFPRLAIWPCRLFYSRISWPCKLKARMEGLADPGLPTGGNGSGGAGGGLKARPGRLSPGDRGSGTMNLGAGRRRGGPGRPGAPSTKTLMLRGGRAGRPSPQPSRRPGQRASRLPDRVADRGGVDRWRAGQSGEQPDQRLGQADCDRPRLRLVAPQASTKRGLDRQDRGQVAGEPPGPAVAFVSGWQRRCRWSCRNRTPAGSSGSVSQGLAHSYAEIRAVVLRQAFAAASCQPVARRRGLRPDRRAGLPARSAPPPVAPPTFNGRR